MQTELPAGYLATSEGRRADGILRSCVHCGFCNATCPTYELLGDELDGPRGRIYLIKEMLETQQADALTRRHLDRCLTCRACETTCPSGVAYGVLAEIGREFLEAELPRPAAARWQRRWLLAVVPHPARFRRWLRLGRLFRPLLPGRLKRQLPPLPRRRPGAARSTDEAGSRRVLVLEGCVQSATTPDVNRALTALLASRGVETVVSPAEVCCGSLALHLGVGAEARATMAANVAAIDAELDGVEAVISTASGCGVTVKDYGRLLAAGPGADAARRVAERTMDAAEYLTGLDAPWQRREPYRRVAWQAPCTLQHGQRCAGLVGTLLRDAGYDLVPVADPHLCCGSAGTYSLLQPALAEQLRERKLRTLERHRPDVIATANVGCQHHLAAAAGVPVVHWLELLQ